MAQFLRSVRRVAREAGRSPVVTLLLAVLGAGLSILALLGNPVVGAVVLGALMIAIGLLAGAAVVAAGEGLYTYVVARDEWDICDAQGQRVVNTKHRTVKYLQDEVFAIRDYAWATGQVGGAVVKQGPGKAIKDYRRDNREHTIILLDGIRKRGNQDDFKLAREFIGSFVQDTESVQIDVIHGTERIESTILFPATRPPTAAWVTMREGDVETQEQLTPQRSNGRQQISWSTEHPRRYALYTVSWNW